MYISLDQLQASLERLDPVHPFFGTSFLAFKQVNLPIGTPVVIDIAGQERALLENYYNPLPISDYYYVPLRSIGKKDRWVLKESYPSSGLQKTRTTTFLTAFLHPRKNQWAWSSDYVLELAKHQRNTKVPAFDLAVWMLRDRDWPTTTQATDIVDYFFRLFNITDDEKRALFDTTAEPSLFKLLQDNPITWESLNTIIGSPEDVTPDEGGALDYIELRSVGPAEHITLDFAERLNIITGDNGLGKTFLLDCAWWALSGLWADPDQPAYPQVGSAKPSISFRISGRASKPQTVSFNKDIGMWPLPDKKRPVLPGIILYIRVDGSCAIWDPAKHYWSVSNDRANGVQTPDAIRLTADEIWDGLEIPLRSGRRQSICNGLISDWITWQYRPSTGIFELFSKVLHRMSPEINEDETRIDEVTLVPGEPTKLPPDDREMPTLKLPYGEVPVVLASAGMKRILSIAYLLVWAWETHKEASRRVGRSPQSKIVIIVDEMEAHLHPRWQRVIVPALLDVISELEAHLQVQLIIATHSPLVMASIEPCFDESIDQLFTLELSNRRLRAQEIPYTKRGSADSWLTSDVFDLKRAYSVEAEAALLAAKQLQLTNDPDPAQVQHVSDDLVPLLSATDPFWPRWKYFAEKHGVHWS